MELCPGSLKTGFCGYLNGQNLADLVGVGVESKALVPDLVGLGLEI